MRIFGTLWDAPVCDGKTAEPVPVGEPCMNCAEPVVEGDQGYIMACFRADGSLEWLPQHKECSLLSVIGHVYGYCSCTDYQGMTERQAGIRVWELVQAGYDDSEFS